MNDSFTQDSSFVTDVSPIKYTQQPFLLISLESHESFHHIIAIIVAFVRHPIVCREHDLQRCSLIHIPRLLGVSPGHGRGRFIVDVYWVRSEEGVSEEASKFTENTAHHLRNPINELFQHIVCVVSAGPVGHGMGSFILTYYYSIRHLTMCHSCSNHTIHM